MTDRTLVVKAVSYLAGRRKDWVAPRIENVLRDALKKAPTLGLRHYPSTTKLAKGTQCVFINDFRDLKGGGLLLEICGYVHGHVPEGFQPDLTKAKAKVEPVTVRGGDGTPRSLGSAYRCLAYGQVLVMEAIRGGGGSGALADLLTDVFRRLVEEKFPTVDMCDIGSSDLRKMIKAKGGVKAIRARIIDVPDEVEGSTYGKLLLEAKNSVGGAKRCEVYWEAEGKLDAENAVAMMEEADDDTLAGVTLEFNAGGSISDLRKYREKKTVKVADDGDGRPLVTEIEAALFEYLAQLRDPKLVGPITSDGTLKAVKLLGEK